MMANQEVLDVTFHMWWHIVLFVYGTREALKVRYHLRLQQLSDVMSAGINNAHEERTVVVPNGTHYHISQGRIRIALRKARLHESFPAVLPDKDSSVRVL